MVQFFQFLLCLCLLCCHDVSLAAYGTLTVSYAAEYDLHSVADRDWRENIADVWKAWGRAAGVRVELKPFPAAVLAQAVDNGTVDIALGEAGSFDQRLVQGPVFHQQTVSVYVLEGMPVVGELSALRGYVVGVVAGSSAERELGRRAADLFVHAYPNLDAVLKAVRSGTIRAFVLDASPDRSLLDGRLETASCVHGGDFICSRLYAWYARRSTDVGKLLCQGSGVLPLGGSLWPAESATGIVRTLEWSGLRFHGVGAGVGLLVFGCAGLVLWRRRTFDENARLEASMRALRQSERRFEKAFHASPAAQLISEIATGRLIDVNQRWVEMTGYPKEEQIGRTSVELGVWQSVADRAESMKLLAEKGSFKDQTVRFVTRSGQIRYTLWSAEIIILDGQAVLLSLILDDTERRESEDALRKSESLYRSVIDNIQDVFYRTDTDGILTMVSPSALRVFGYSSLEEVLGRHIASFWWTPARRELMLQKIQELGRVQDYEVKVRHQDESPRFMATSSHYYRDERGEICGIEGTFRDITNRKKAEEELRQSEEKFYRLFKLSPDAISLTKWETGRLVDVNDALTIMSGFSREELIGRTTIETGLLSEVKRRWMVEQLALGGRIKNWEVEIPRKDGSVIFGSLCCQLVVFGERRFILAVVRDLTELKRMQEMMIQTEKMISVGGIAAGIAHEINNPLGIIVQNAQNLELRTRAGFRKNMAVAENLGLDMALCERYMQERGIYKFIGDIQDAARRAAEIIRHMMEFSRKSDSSRGVFELPAIVDKAVELAGNDYDLRKSYDFRQIRVVREYNVSQPSLTCSATEIEQVVLNLLRNAAQAIAAFAAAVDEPTIIIRISETLGFMRLEIEDNGPGIPAELQAKIFEPFFTTKPPGVGTGLGLSVSYFIITRGHGGEMTVSSRPGRGSTFVIDLPRECQLESLEQEELRIQ